MDRFVMSLPIEAIARYATIITDLARQMTELAELRRAVCIQMALRSRPRTTRRPIGNARRGRPMRVLPVAARTTPATE